MVEVRFTFNERARMFQDLVKSLLRGRKKKVKSVSRRIRLNLETLENRVVPNAYTWFPSVTNTAPAFADPNNWIDRATGHLALTAPDSNTDCYFTATSPTLYPCYTNYVGLPLGSPPSCRSINTDPNWHGDIHANIYGLHVYGGTSVFKGGTITTDIPNAGGADGGKIEISGGTFDYDSPDLNQNANYPSGILIVYIDNGGVFKVDWNCLSINAAFEIGVTDGGSTFYFANGPDSPGTLLLNPNAQRSPDTTFYASPLGTLLLLTSPPPPPAPHNFVWSPTTTDTNWNNPNNWTDSVTGLKETNAPGAHDDVVFGATSPTRCDLFTNGTCQTITTDASWNGRIILHGSKLTVNGANAPSGKSSVIDGGAIDVIFGGTIDEVGGEFDYAVSELGASLIGPGRLNVAVENGGKFTVDSECHTINSYFFVGMSYPYFTNPPSLGTLTFNTTDPSASYSMSNTSLIDVGSKGIVNFLDQSQLSNLALIDYGTVNLGAGVVLTTTPIGILHAIQIESGGTLNTPPVATADLINGDLNVLSGGTITMNGDNSGNFSNLIVNGTLTIAGTLNVYYDLGYLNGNIIQANSVFLPSSSVLNIHTEGTPQLTGWYYEDLVVVGPIGGTYLTFGSVQGVANPHITNYTSEVLVEWMQA